MSKWARAWRISGQLPQCGMGEGWLHCAAEQSATCWRKNLSMATSVENLTARAFNSLAKTIPRSVAVDIYFGRILRHRETKRSRTHSLKR